MTGTVCLPCELDVDERLPQTVEGWACWRAAEVSVRGGMVQPHIDMSSAILIAERSGVNGGVAAELLAFVQAGMAAGLARKRSAKE